MLDNGILIGKYTDSMQGIVISGSRNMFAVECADGCIRQCTLKGKKLKDIQGYYNPLAPGDIVEIGTDALNDNQGQIIALIPRKNEFVRWNVKGRAPQLLAANLDYLLCTWRYIINYISIYKIKNKGGSGICPKYYPLYKNIGEYYANFGLLGIMVFMYILGWVSSSLKKYVFQREDLDIYIMYSILYPLFFQWIARGNFSGNLYLTFFAVLPILLKNFFIKEREGV